MTKSLGGGGGEGGKRARQEFMCKTQKGDGKYTKSLKTDTSSSTYHRQFIPNRGELSSSFFLFALAVNVVRVDGST